jgi:hypothetical protein
MARRINYGKVVPAAVQAMSGLQRYTRDSVLLGTRTCGARLDRSRHAHQRRG